MAEMPSTTQKKNRALGHFIGEFLHGPPRGLFFRAALSFSFPPLFLIVLAARRKFFVTSEREKRDGATNMAF